MNEYTIIKLNAKRDSALKELSKERQSAHTLLISLAYRSEWINERLAAIATTEQLTEWSGVTSREAIRLIKKSIENHKMAEFEFDKKSNRWIIYLEFFNNKNPKFN